MECQKQKLPFEELYRKEDTYLKVKANAFFSHEHFWF